MPDFVSLGTWLREPLVPVQPVEVDEPPIVADPPLAQTPRSEPAEEELLDDVCARVRRFRAMLDDAFDYVQERGEPKAPLCVRVHPARVAEAQALAIPLVADVGLAIDDAVLELHCGSIDARLQVEIGRLLEERPPR